MSRRRRPPLRARTGISNYIAFGRGLQADVLKNFTHQDLQQLIAARAALALAVAVRVAFLVNGLLSLPLYCCPMQAGGAAPGGGCGC